MYYYSSTPSTITSNFSLASLGMWIVISAVIALMGGLVVYFVFLTKENKEKLTGKAKWLYSFLNFDKFFSETLLKIAYIVTAIFITLSSFAVISTSFLSFLCYLVFGNILARICYEFALVILIICKNTTEINAKMKEKDIVKGHEAKKEIEKEEK